MIKCENACPRGKFDGCCHKCPDFHTCPDSCQEDPNTCGSSTFDEEAGLQAFQQSQLATLNAIASLTSHKKAIEEQEKTMKAALYDAMMKFGVKKFESDVLNLTLVAPSNSTTIDSAKLKKKYPAIAAECSKPNPKAGYVKITLKGGEKYGGNGSVGYSASSFQGVAHPEQADDSFVEAQRRITAKLLSVPVEDVTVITKDAYDAATEEPEDDFDDRDW